MDNPQEVVKTTAKSEGCVVACTGVVDYVSDGISVIEIRNGHHYLGEITGIGCMTGSAIGCLASSARALSSSHNQQSEGFALTYGDMLAATVGGILLICVAGEIAATHADVQGPGTFRAALLDALYNMDADTLLKKSRLVVV